MVFGFVYLSKIGVGECEKLSCSIELLHYSL